MKSDPGRSSVVISDGMSEIYAPFPWIYKRELFVFHPPKILLLVNHVKVPP
jgi:hypothetical protein